MIVTGAKEAVVEVAVCVVLFRQDVFVCGCAVVASCLYEIKQSVYGDGDIRMSKHEKGGGGKRRVKRRRRRRVT